MNNPIILQDFVGGDNLEFVISNKNSKIQKILYRSFGDNAKFRQKILYYLLENNLLEPFFGDAIINIFNLKTLQFTMFHFATDEETERYKFYISLYHHTFRESLGIISNIKNILKIEKKYFLEENFKSFDCIGFDIKNGKIDMKIYELLKMKSLKQAIPENISSNIKECGVLKDMKKRKKYFYKLEIPININLFSNTFNVSGIEEIQNNLYDYTLRKRVTYYCKDAEREEIYFI